MIGLVAHQEGTLLAKQTPQPLLLGPPTFVGPLENPKVCKIIFQLCPCLCVHLPAHDSSPPPYRLRGGGDFEEVPCSVLKVTLRDSD